MSAIGLPVSCWHTVLGDCQVLRTEGVNWVIRQLSTGIEYRIPPSRRKEFSQKPPKEASGACSAPSDPTRPSWGMIPSLRPASDAARGDSNDVVPGGDGQDIMSVQEVSRLPAQEWTRLREWTQSTNVFSSAERNLCTLFAILRRIGSLSENDSLAAKKLLQRAINLGFDRHSAKASLVAVSGGQVHGDGRTATAPTGPTREGSTNCVAPASDAGARLARLDERQLRQAFQSLRMGLPPTSTGIRQFAVGIECIERAVRDFLDRIDQKGGAAIDLRGQYGDGKTFLLHVIEEMALEAGYLVARTEVDATEHRLDKPHNIFRSLMRNLRVPEEPSRGIRALVPRIARALDHLGDGIRDRTARAEKRRSLLQQMVQCAPLSWLLADDDFADKPELIGELAGEPIGPVPHARAAHILPGSAYDWPTFRYGTQGDVGSYLLSGLGRLARCLHFRGMLLLLDEMEKWQELDWVGQTRAGNLLGGLIWAATAPMAKRRCRIWRPRWGTFPTRNCCDHTPLLEHSGWCGGFPFSTEDPCHLGVAVAMTPRGDDSPEYKWQQFGDLQILDLPQFTRASVERFFHRVVPHYCRAYRLPHTPPAGVFHNAIQRWSHQGILSARSAVTAVVESLDEWRDQQEVPA